MLYTGQMHTHLFTLGAPLELRTGFNFMRESSINAAAFV